MQNKGKRLTTIQRMHPLIPSKELMSELSTDMLGETAVRHSLRNINEAPR